MLKCKSQLITFDDLHPSKVVLLKCIVSELTLSGMNIIFDGAHKSSLDTAVKDGYTSLNQLILKRFLKVTSI